MSCTTQLLRHSRKVVFIFIFFRILFRKVNLKFADVAMNYHFVCQFLILSDSLLWPAFLFGKIRLVKMIMALQLILIPVPSGDVRLCVGLLVYADVNVYC